MKKFRRIEIINKCLSRVFSLHSEIVVGHVWADWRSYCALRFSDFIGLKFKQDAT